MWRRHFAAALLGLASITGEVVAQNASALSTNDRAAVDLAIARGKLIYAYDQAAWHGTDDLAAKMPDFATRAGGWIVDGPAESPEIIFFDREVAPHALYVAQLRDNRLVSSKLLGPDDDRTISEPRQRLIAARQTAIKAWRDSQDAPICTPSSPNTVVLPPAGPGEPTLVYILTPQTDLNAIPFGGHYRIAVDAGGKAGKPRAFSRSCLSMPLSEKGNKKPAAIGITHLLDSVPTEIHVFSSYAAKSPVIVLVTDPKRRIFWIEGGAVRQMRDDELKGLD